MTKNGAREVRIEPVVGDLSGQNRVAVSIARYTLGLPHVVVADRSPPHDGRRRAQPLHVGGERVDAHRRRAVEQPAALVPTFRQIDEVEEGGERQRQHLIGVVAGAVSRGVGGCCPATRRVDERSTPRRRSHGGRGARRARFGLENFDERRLHIAPRHIRDADMNELKIVCKLSIFVVYKRGARTQTVRRSRAAYTAAKIAFCLRRGNRDLHLRASRPNISNARDESTRAADYCASAFAKIGGCYERVLRRDDC